MMNDSQVLAAPPPIAKILIIGDPRVGKSCILAQFAENFYTPDTLMTIGIDCKTKKIKIDDTLMKLQIWDTAGQEKYKSITQNFYKNAMGVIMVFDLTDTKSFDNIQKWLGQVRANSSETVCLLLVGNKCDDKEYRAVSQEKINAFTADTGIPYIETSAKENINIQEAFEKIARDIKNRYFAETHSNRASKDVSMRRVLTSSFAQQKKDNDYSKCC